MKELQSFFELVNYCRRFICNFTKIAKPLTELTKNVLFFGHTQPITYFKSSKTLLTSHLYLPNLTHQKWYLWQQTRASAFLMRSWNEIAMMEATLPHCFPEHWINSSRTTMHMNWSCIEFRILWEPRNAMCTARNLSFTQIITHKDTWKHQKFIHNDNSVC